MRMWLGVDPTEMCNQHLLGEHNELHMVRGNIENDRFNYLEGHAKEGQIDTTKLVSRHKKLENEMESRGMNVNSDMESLPEGLDGLESNSRVDRYRNRRELFNRCKKCRKNRSRLKNLKVFLEGIFFK